MEKFTGRQTLADVQAIVVLKRNVGKVSRGCILAHRPTKFPGRKGCAMSAPQPVLEPLPPTQAQTAAPSQEEIQMRAYQLWQTRLRHGVEGTAEQDWALAKQELAGPNPDSSAERESEKV